MLVKRSIVLVLIVFQFTGPVGIASTTTPSDSAWDFSLGNNEPDRKRNYWLPPLLSFILPGFDQWYEHQWGPAAVYTGSAVAGTIIYASAVDHLQYQYTQSLTSKNDAYRFAMLGAQLHMAAGSYSAYHSFRTAVRTQQKSGNFTFLTQVESVPELLTAPVHFEYITRFTTIIPLVVIAGVVGLELATNSNIQPGPFTLSDAGFAGGFSYLAGTNEEALFRGVLMPMGMHWTGSPLVANLGQGALFAAAHISSQNPLPWPQLLLGLWLGWVSQYRDWTLSESIFIHTWWDIIAFVADYATQQTQQDDRIREPFLRLPTINVPF